MMIQALNEHYHEHWTLDNEKWTTDKVYIYLFDYYYHHSVSIAVRITVEMKPPHHMNTIYQIPINQ